MRVEMFSFLVAGAICIFGALGVVLLRNPVHNALSLVATLFGVAVLFIVQEAYFLAAIQVIVYAGAIVVLFLFVIMLLGVDRRDRERPDPLPGQRAAGIVVGAAILGLSLAALLAATGSVTGAPSLMGPLSDGESDVVRLGRIIFTDYVFVFEITAVLLTVAVIGAVVLSRRAGPPIDLDEFPDGTAVEHLGLHEVDDGTPEGAVVTDTAVSEPDEPGAAEPGAAETVAAGADDGGAR